MQPEEVKEAKKLNMEEVRKTYPRAGLRWVEEEDKRL
jgi:hypothetical protein